MHCVRASDLEDALSLAEKQKRVSLTFGRNAASLPWGGNAKSMMVNHTHGEAKMKDNVMRHGGSDSTEEGQKLPTLDSHVKRTTSCATKVAILHAVVAPANHAFITILDTQSSHERMRAEGIQSQLSASTIPPSLATSGPRMRGEGIPSPLPASTNPPSLLTSGTRIRGEGIPSPLSIPTTPPRLVTSWHKQASKERGEGISGTLSASTTPPMLDTVENCESLEVVVTPKVVKGRGNGAKERKKSTRSGTSSDRCPSLIDMTRGRTRSPEDEGPSLICLYGGGIGDEVLKSPPCMRQAFASSLAPKRGRIPLGNHCRANSALPPHPQSYDELHIHPKTAAGVVAFLSGFNDYVDTTNHDRTETPEENFAVKEAGMKDNEQRVNLPLSKTSWTTFKDEPAPQYVQQSNHCPSGQHEDKHVNVKEIHISENLQKLEAHGWKVRALRRLVDDQMMGASTLNILTELEEREGTHTREGERTLEDAPKLQEQETDREEEKEDSAKITCTDEVLKQTSTTTVNPSSVSSDLRVSKLGLNAPREFMTYQAMTACVPETSGDFEAQGDVAKSRKKIPTITSRPKTPTRNQRQINEAGTQNTRFIFHAQRRNSTSPTSMPSITPIWTGQTTGQDWYRRAHFKRLSI